ncbi:hypothetical protein SNEBB_003025 [Seison nebaliae]|nr:hypothetical protein SNEBB_003025 [Seison nebaliae]
MTSQRLTLRKRAPYSTKSNKVRKVRTPKGKLVFHYRKKIGAIPLCGDTKLPLRGIKRSRPSSRHLMKKTKAGKHVHLKVTRAYGGVLSAPAVRERIIRAFLIEEDRLVSAISRKMTQKKLEEEQERKKKEAKEAKEKKIGGKTIVAKADRKRKPKKVEQ